MTPRLVLATANAGKAKELAILLDGLGYAVVSHRDLGSVELPPEGATSYRDNALEKARTAARAAPGAVAVGDDSGLEVDALGGRPGAASARYGGSGLTDAERVTRLLAEVGPVASRGARFRCLLALVAPWGEEAVVEGVVEGVLTDRPRGSRGFGYDPIFLVPALGRTFGELPDAEKDRLSHRARAAAAARPILVRWATRLRQAS
ncbi:MAG TPA: RdgB/HAM1 family non-canonical purine NTP pyrophosphatase [Methylomirabilota bacterium]